MKRVAVTGATGFIGRAVIDRLLARGDQVTALVRSPKAAYLPPAAEIRRFAALSGDPAPELFEGHDAVVHVVGEPIAGRWTPPKKKAIYDSRVLGTKNLVNSLAACTRRPKVLVAASAVGYYGDRGDEVLDERSTPGHDFLADLTVEWERHAQAAAKLGMRVVCLRQAVVLGREGSALQPMLLPFRLGIGGPLARGRQWFPWIHIDDVVALYLFAIDNEQLKGAVNAASPDVARNVRFAHALGHALRRPSFARVPQAVLKIALGEVAEYLVASQLVLPIRAQSAGFQFRHERLEQALLDLLDPASGRKPATAVLESSQEVRAEAEKIFPFIANLGQLGQIVPPDLKFELLRGPVIMEMGAMAEFAFTFRGRRLRWRAVIVQWQPPRRFIAEQIRGQCVLWRHEHAVRDAALGAEVYDRIEYLLPMGPFWRALVPGIRAELERIFNYRGQRVAQLVGGDGSSR